jgi:hypothetical protein
MPRWIYTAPPDSCAKSEQAVAAFFSTLGPEFSIRWGFPYEDNGSVWREGDFIIQGPDGHILVVEAKGGPCTVNPSTGRWTTADGENPFNQLEAEWKGVLNPLLAAADEQGHATPFVDRVLALPDLAISPGQASYQGQPRLRILDQGDLASFEKWWSARFSGFHLKCTLAEARRLFNGLYAASAPDEASSHTLDFAESLLERHTRQRFEILDALEENSQLLVSGGPGTGKTWLAIEQARRWAKQNRKVLFLCYNLELETYLRPVCRRASPHIQVFSYESLAAHLLGDIRRASEMPSEEATAYFEQTLPGLLHAHVRTPGFQPPYDALVADEAQDHNTGTAGSPLGLAGWWSIYFGLLKGGAEAPVAIFHDHAQRLSLRAGAFDPAALRDSLLQPVNLRLRHPVRYTRQLRRFISRLKCPATQDLIRDFHGTLPLPEGPEPEIHSFAPHEEGAKCAQIAKEWLDKGLAKCHEIAVLYPSSRNPPAWIGKIHGISFVDTSSRAEEASRVESREPSATSDSYTSAIRSQPSAIGMGSSAIPCFSINRAKGLERRAIILTGLPVWEGCTKNDYQARTFVLGATRAQQLLAVLQ